jgi:zinc protease
VDLDDVKTSVEEGFRRFETEWFTEEDVARIRAGIETDFYGGIPNVGGKAYYLAEYNEFAGDPAFIAEDVARMRAVTGEDIKRVYEQYLRDKPFVMTSFVPEEHAALAVEGSEQFVILDDTEEAASLAVERFPEVAAMEPIVSSFDRSVEPPKGPDPIVTLPDVWSDTLTNEMKVFGIEKPGLPLVQFALTLKGGQWLDDIDKVGVANLVSIMLMEGTQTRTATQFEEAVDELGAELFTTADRESISIQGTCLASKFNEVFQLVEEMLLHPRWDGAAFERVRQETLDVIDRERANPPAVAQMVFDRLLYGESHIFSIPTTGTEQSVKEISLEDLRSFYEENFSPSVAFLTVVGGISKRSVVETVRRLEEHWAPKDLVFPRYALPSPPDSPMVYFVDIPGSRQSVIRIGNLALPVTAPDYYPATVMNFKLGGDIDGLVSQVLTHEKGYTYGARTSFSGSHYTGVFVAYSRVQSSATLESVQIFRDLMLNYRNGISAEDLESTRDALIKSNVLRFAGLNSKLSMLRDIALYDFPRDYVAQREAFVRDLTLEQHRELARTYINPDQMIYLVVGDAASQSEPLERLGLGRPVLIELN